eukprot:6130308-Pyramimonas_sp.AAC.1
MYADSLRGGEGDRARRGRARAPPPCSPSMPSISTTLSPVITIVAAPRRSKRRKRAVSRPAV